MKRYIFILLGCLMSAAGEVYGNPNLGDSEQVDFDTKALMRAIDERIAAERSSKKDKDCRADTRLGVEVCFNSFKSKLKCRQSVLGNHYDLCEVRLDYEITRSKEGPTSFKVDVECSATIDYDSKLISGHKSERGRQASSFYVRDYDSNYINLSFSLSDFLEIDSVKLASSKCEIAKFW